MAPTRRSLSEFNIETQIGKGSFARVYRVTRNSDHKRYAIKEVNLRQMTQKEREDAVNEVRLLASIRHDRVIRYFDAFIESDRMYIVMEYAKGGDLYMKMKKHKEKKIFLEEKTILDIFAQVCEGVATLHSLGVVHRDIKSPNVFMMGGGIVKVGDLGIATLLKGRNATARIGTPYYMSPELWRAQPYNQKSDMWALGCLLYEMTCLRHPFDAKDEKTLGRKVVRGFYQAPPKGYSKELVKTIKSLLQVDPQKRPSIIDLLNSPFLRRRLEEDDALWLEQDFVLGVPSLLDTIKVPKDIAKLCDHLPSNCYAEERISIRPSMSQSVPVTRRTVEEDEDTLPAIAPKTAPPDETTAVVSNNAENSKEGRSGGVNSSLACRSERSLDGHVSPFDGGKESERSGIIGPSPPSVEKVKKSRPAVIRVRENPLAGQGKPHHGKGGHKSEGHHHNHNHHHHASHHHHHGGHQRSSLDEKQPQHPELEDEQEAGQREKGKGMESESAKKKPGHEKERTKNSDGHTHVRRKETSKGGGDSHHKEGMTRLPKLSNVNINSLKMRAHEIVLSSSGEMPMEMKEKYGDPFDVGSLRLEARSHAQRVYSNRMHRRVWVNGSSHSERDKERGAERKKKEKGKEAGSNGKQSSTTGIGKAQRHEQPPARLSNVSKATTASRDSNQFDHKHPLPSLGQGYVEGAREVGTRLAVPSHDGASTMLSTNSSTCTIGSPPKTPAYLLQA